MKKFPFWTIWRTCQKIFCMGLWTFLTSVTWIKEERLWSKAGLRGFFNLCSQMCLSCSIPFNAKLFSKTFLKQDILDTCIANRHLFFPWTFFPPLTRWLVLTFPFVDSFAAQKGVVATSKLLCDLSLLYN